MKRFNRNDTKGRQRNNKDKNDKNRARYSVLQPEFFE